MEHISDTMTRMMDGWQRTSNRYAFYRQYYPQYADEWINSEQSVTGRRADMQDVIRLDNNNCDRSPANSGAVSNLCAKEGGTRE